MARDTKINVTLDFNAQIQDVQHAVQNIQKSLQGINLPPNINKSFLNLFSSLEDELRNFASLSSKTLTSSGDFSAIEKSGKRVLELYRKLGIEVDALGDLTKTKPGTFFSPQVTKTINGATQALGRYRKATEAGVGAIDKKKKALIDYQVRLETAVRKEQALNSKTQVDDKVYAERKKAVDELTEAIERQKAALAQASQANTDKMQASDRSTPDRRTREYKTMVAEQQRLTQLVEQQATAQVNLDGIISKSQYKSQLTQAQQSQRKWTLSIEQTRQEIEELGDGGAGKAFKQLLEDIKDFDGIDPSTIKTVEDLESIIRNLATISGNQLHGSMNQVKRDFGEVEGAAENLEQELRENKGAIEDFANSRKEIDHLKDSIKQFFSVGNAIQLFKNAVRSAFDTVKELDATMTEAAVVTEFSVGDMWEKLPEYSQEASQLGARINDLYGATTLYYQQGLKTNEAMGVGVETMKMARIANMDATEATTAMTAALRGFNMEVNEMNAQVVNDVYSELAAITAADTSQIATAMSKTASIAASANMEFENTAALLAQIIETTQEAPETAGTALKTIIARFSEVKKLANEGQNTGEDEEGEAIDVNKIQTALRSVGISMDDFFKGTKGLDDVLMRLAEKWDTLDFETQRYIATTAAGSRQQSRFIAMMSDYERTVELTNAANNSAGASTEQFNKTLDSLDSKLNELKNAWDRFTMGLANSDLLKAGVDTLTSILETINNIIDAISGGSDVLKTFTTALSAFAAFKLGQKGFNKLLGQAVPKEGILGSLLGNVKGKEIRTLGAGWGKEAVNGFKTSFVTGTKNLFKGNILKDFTFGNIINAEEITEQTKKAGAELNKLKGKIGTFALGKEGIKLHYDINHENFDAASQSLSRLVEEGKLSSEQMEKLGIDMNMVNENAKLSQLKNTAQTLSQVATVGAMAGAALMAFVPVLEKMGASDEAITVVKGIATALMTLPVVLKVVEMAVHAFSASTSAAISAIPIIGWIAGIISVVIALISIFSQMGSASERALKKAEEAAERTHQAADKVREDFEDINDILETIGERQTALEDLTRGTNEWKKAVQELNQEVLELIALDPEILQYGIIKNTAGVLSIDTQASGYQRYLEDQLNETKEANTAEVSADLLTAQRRFKKVSDETLFKAGDTGYVKDVNDYFKTNDSLHDTVIYSLTQSSNDYTGKKEDISSKDFKTISTALEEALRNGTLEFSGNMSQNQMVAETYIRDLVDNGLLDIENKEQRTNIGMKDAIYRYFNYNLVNYAALERYYQASEELQEEFSRIILPEKISNLESANVSEENYDVASALQDQIYSSIYEGIADSDIVIDDTLKQKYANAQGYILRNGTFYQKDAETGKEEKVKVTDETLIGYGKLKETNNQVIERLQALNKKISTLDPTQAERTRNLISKQGQGLTTQDARIFDRYFDDKGRFQDDHGEFQSLYENWGGDAIFGSFENFVQLVGNSLDTFNNTITKTTSNWKNAFIDGDNPMSKAIVDGKLELSTLIPNLENVELTANQFEGLANSLMRVYNAGGDVKTFGENLSRILGTIKSEDVPKVLDILSTDNLFSNTDSIDLAIEQIEELGYEIDDNLVNALIEASNAIKKINIEKLEEQLASLDSVIKKVTEKVQEGTSIYSKEEIDSLREAGFDTEQFVRIGIDEYSFLGDSNDLLENLNETVSQILSQITQDLSDQVDIGSRINSVMTNTNTNWHMGDGQYKYTAGDIVNKLIYGQLNANNFDEENISSLKGLAEDLGINSTVVENSTAENLIKAITQQVSTYWGVNGEVFKQNEADLAQTETDAITMGYAETDNQGYINAVGKYMETRESYGELTETLDGLINKEEGLSIATEKAVKQLREQGKAVRTSLVKQLVINVNAAAKNYKNFTQILGNNIETLSKGTKGSQKYNAALERITESAQKVFGSQVTSDFIEQNQELFEQLAQGGETGQQAYEQISKIIANNFLNSLNLAEHDLYRINELTSQLDGLNLEIGSTADFTQTFSELTTLMGSAEKAKEYLESLGYHVEFVQTGTKKIQVGYDAELWNGIPMNARPHFEEVPVYETYIQKKDSTGSFVPNSGGGGGGSKPKKQHWENPYDELYNTQEALDETLRDRNQLEIDYDQILKDRTKTFKDLYENQKAQLKNLEREKQLQNELLAGRKAQLASLASESYIATRRDGDEEEQFRTTFAEEFKRLGLGSINQYMGYNQETGELWIDWDKIEAIEKNEKTGEDQGALIEALKDRYDEIAGQIEETEDALYEIEDRVAEILDQGREEYEDLEQQVYDAIVNERQTLIDNYSTLSETLSESSSEMLTALQESIDLERQIRDNTKQEEDIAEMEARLAYLRADTSGGNRLQILELEEQLAEARESYGDTLIDQEIERLNRANEEAAEQRERQIEIMQSQLDYQQETGYFWEQAYDLIDAMFNEDFSLNLDSETVRLLQANSDWKAMSEQQRDTWAGELIQSVNQGFAWLAGEGSSRQLEKIGITSGNITFTNAKGQVVEGVVNEDGSVTAKDGSVYHDVFQSFGGKYMTAEETGEVKETSTPSTPSTPESATEPKETFPYGKASETTGILQQGSRGKQVKAVQYALNKLGYGNAGTTSVDGEYGGGTVSAVRKFQRDMGISADGMVGDDTRKKFALKQYKTGGLADFTGPAWLDGTKSHPELILNQQDTRNFIILKDILSEALGAMSGRTSEQGGNNYFDIDIIVDEIGSDYDVDQLSERIKQNIYEDGMYRNVNTISLQR